MAPAIENSVESCLDDPLVLVASEKTSVQSISRGQPTGLCERCQKDDLEGFLLGHYDYPRETELHLDYESGSFKGECTPCVQIASLMAKMSARNTPKLYSPPKQYGSLRISRHLGEPRGLFVVHSSGSLAHWYVGQVRPTTTDELKCPRSSTNVSIQCQRSSMNDMVEMQCVDYERIKSWIRSCESHHREVCCRSELQQKVEVITVIDCRTKRLKEIRSDERYIALSYLWGISAEEAPQYQKDLPKILPRTISDAMIVALSLSVSYLWIDRYCIDQQDHEKKERIIRHMDRIYKDAFLTIIASAGDDPHHGLPGVSITPRSSLDHMVLGRCTLFDPNVTKLEIENCVWNTRGWTYQEALLSCRRLVFTQSQTYFQCRCVAHLESATLPHADTVVSRIFHSIGEDSVNVYLSISKFWNKRLSFDSDRLNAIQGILTASEGKESAYLTDHPVYFKTHFWGIPIFSNSNSPQITERSSFKSGLFFSYSYLHREFLSTTFPTWSWAAREHIGGRCPGNILQYAATNLINVSKWSSSIYVTHKSGQSIEIGKFTRISQDYKDFLPHLQVTSWSLWATLNDWLLKDFFPHKGIRVNEWGDAQDLDSTGWHCNKKILHVYIGTYENHERRPKVCGLLLEEITPGTFRRVGIWRAVCAFNSKHVSVHELFTEYFKPNPAITDKRWEKRTVRII